MSEEHVALIPVPDSDKLENVTYLLPSEKLTFIPAYATLKVRSLENIDLQIGKVTLNGTIHIRIATENLGQDILESLSNSITIRLNETTRTLSKTSEDVTICDDQSSGDKLKQIMYTWRFSEQINFDADVSNSPFDQVNIPVKLEIVNRDVKDKANFRINFHTSKRVFENVHFDKDELHRLKDFSVAYSELDAKPVKESKKQKEKLVYSHFPAVTFNVAVYRQPGKLFMTSILPLLVLSILMMGVIFTAPVLGARIQAIGILLLAYFAFLPSLRRQIPLGWSVSLVDQLNMLYILELIFVFIDSIWQEAGPNIVIRIIFLILILMYVFVAILLVIVNAARFSVKRKEWDQVPEDNKKKADLKTWRNREIEVASEVEVVFDPRKKKD